MDYNRSLNISTLQSFTTLVVLVNFAKATQKYIALTFSPSELHLLHIIYIY